ncbi:MAG: helix-turn-helix domain-containing protein, partial [Polyangiaceae bacterium]
VRFIAATNRDLRAQCAAGAFREDLFFRLNGITVRIPPLRERTGEIPALAKLFLTRAYREMGSPELALTPAAVERLTRHRWPGNIRELKNVMDRAVLLAQGSRIDAADLPIEFDGEADVQTDMSMPGPSGHLRKEVEEFERQRIVHALEECGGNQTKAARLLGISRRTLLTRLDEYDVPRPRK